MLGTPGNTSFEQNSGGKAMWFPEISLQSAASSNLTTLHLGAKHASGHCPTLIKLVSASLDDPWLSGRRAHRRRDQRWQMRMKKVEDTWPCSPSSPFPQNSALKEISIYADEDYLFSPTSEPQVQEK